MDSVFNADQNIMSMSYFTKYNAEYRKFRFYLKLQLTVELIRAGSTVYMLYGIQNPLDENYDYVRV